jgi:hypothetical protein
MSTTQDKPTVLRPPTKAHALETKSPTIDPLPVHRIDPTLATHPPVAPPKPLFLDCQIEEMPNGEGVANIVIPADVMPRLKRKAQGLSVAEYTWGIIRRALYAETWG